MIALAQDTRIAPYKNREVDYTKQMEVYRCLNRGGKKSGPVYSVRQNGKVVGHTTDLTLHGCMLVVGEAGNQRCKTTGTRNVHAYIRGWVCNYWAGEFDQITYNPHVHSSFIFKSTNLPVPSSVSLARVDALGAHVRTWK